MGIELVEGRDLVVHRTASSCGRRAGSSGSTSSTGGSTTTSSTRSPSAPTRLLGVPGCSTPTAAGNVTLANAIGTGRRRRQGDLPLRARDDPLLPRRGADLAERPDLRRREEDDDLRLILDRIDELVVKAVDQSGGYGMLIGPPRRPRSTRSSGGSSRPSRATTSRSRRSRSRGTRRSSTARSTAATSTCGRSC